MDQFDWSRLSPHHWLADVTEPINHPLYVLLGVILTLGLIVGIYLRLVVETAFDGQPRAQMGRLGNLLIAICGSGLAVLAFRWQPAPFVSKRLWFYLWSLTSVIAVAYFLYFPPKLRPRPSATDKETSRAERLSSPSTIAGGASNEYP